ncbi:MAG: PilZ domain-containing protein [Spirochaetaceae bacterium]|jgi:hypothetical protein|nr:PilZ domain-containing protein [Spirochaetaceae bacterium]
MIPLFLVAQSTMFDFGKKNDPKSLITFGIVVGVAILFIALANMVSGNGPNGVKGSLPSDFSRRKFRKEGFKIGLTKDQLKLLEGFIKSYSVRRPYDLLKNSRTLNNTLGRALRDLGHMEAPPSVVEARKLELYRIKQLLERLEPEETLMQSTKDLSLSQRITIEKDKDKRFNSIITANLKEFYCVKVPTNSYGEQIRWNKGTKISVSLWTQKGEEVHFISKLLGYNSVKKITSILLGHSKRVSRSNLRRYRRKKLQRPVNVYPIRVIERMEGRRIKKEAVVDKNLGRSGTMIDLSAGGCALTTTKPLKKGDICKLVFEPEQGNPVNTFGKVVDIKMQSRIRASLHIMFTRASTKNLNRINEFVYDFQ